MIKCFAAYIVVASPVTMWTQSRSGGNNIGAALFTLTDAAVGCECCDAPQTRVNDAFSKKAENHRTAIALHYARYNFVRQYKSLRTSPAMAAGISDRMWTIGELVERTLK